LEGILLEGTGEFGEHIEGGVEKGERGSTRFAVKKLEKVGGDQWMREIAVGNKAAVGE
jgi:hypothetical protein